MYGLDLPPYPWVPYTFSYGMGRGLVGDGTRIGFELYGMSQCERGPGPLPRRPAGYSLVTHVWISAGIEVHL